MPTRFNNPDYSGTEQANTLHTILNGLKNGIGQAADYAPILEGITAGSGGTLTSTANWADLGQVTLLYVNIAWSGAAPVLSGHLSVSVPTGRSLRSNTNMSAMLLNGSLRYTLIAHEASGRLRAAGAAANGTLVSVDGVGGASPSAHPVPSPSQAPTAP